MRPASRRRRVPAASSRMPAGTLQVGESSTNVQGASQQQHLTTDILRACRDARVRPVLASDTLINVNQAGSIDIHRSPGAGIVLDERKNIVVDRSPVVLRIQDDIR